MPNRNLRNGRFSEENRLYHITTTTRNREPVFEQLDHARLLIREMRSLHEAHHVRSLCWVIMPDHLHWLFALGSSRPLYAVIRELKCRSARRINALRDERQPVWQRAYHDHALRKEEDIKQVARYIVANPLRNGLVQNIGDYPHWDAMWL